ncbi:hypothetical protein CB1_000914036 [Camelus ferus]|nr:hypothetical protein CB1_000914036 [Camelus ferus]
MRRAGGVAGHHRKCSPLNRLEAGFRNRAVHAWKRIPGTDPVPDFFPYPLQKRRVGDLLASYIPEDEALMLRDGRFACAICPHRPVLDTLAMLTAHRGGKKHLSSLQLFYGKQQPGKGMDPNPRQQNELREEAEVEVIKEGRMCSSQGCVSTP